MNQADRFQLLRGDDGVLGLVDQLRLKQKPIVVDFLNPTIRYRVKNGADSELVVKSFGVKASERHAMTLIDATCGLGTDAYLLAVAGFNVLALERNRWVFELVSDGLDRLRRFREKEGLAPLRLEIRNVDSSNYFSSLASGDLLAPDGVYLDPMFEETSVREKSPPKKEMATLRDLLAPESEKFDPTLLTRAIAVSKYRVVVKRPSGAAALPSDVRPQHRLEGKVASYDIYPCRSQKQNQR